LFTNNYNSNINNNQFLYKYKAIIFRFSVESH